MLCTAPDSKAPLNDAIIRIWTIHNPNPRGSACKRCFPSLSGNARMPSGMKSSSSKSRSRQATRRARPISICAVAISCPAHKWANPVAVGKTRGGNARAGKNFTSARLNVAEVAEAIATAAVVAIATVVAVVAAAVAIAMIANRAAVRM